MSNFSQKSSFSGKYVICIDPPNYDFLLRILEEWQSSEHERYFYEVSARFVKKQKNVLEKLNLSLPVFRDLCLKVKMLHRF